MQHSSKQAIENTTTYSDDDLTAALFALEVRDFMTIEDCGEGAAIASIIHLEFTGIADPLPMTTREEHDWIHGAASREVIGYQGQTRAEIAVALRAAITAAVERYRRGLEILSEARVVATRRNMAVVPDETDLYPVDSPTRIRQAGYIAFQPAYYVCALQLKPEQRYIKYGVRG